MLWQRYGTGNVDLDQQPFSRAVEMLGDAMAARQFEVEMMSEAHLRALVDMATAQAKAARRRPAPAIRRGRRR